MSGRSIPTTSFVANADGTGLKRITDNPKYDAEPIVSPDGKRVVFGSQREGNFDVYVMDIDGTNLRRLTDRTGYNGGPWFSPDGTKIVWRAWYPETDAEKAMWRDCMEKNYILAVPLDLWVMDADGSNKKLLLKNGATNFAPSWHPDGKRIIFASNKDDWHDGHQEIRPQLRALPDQQRRHGPRAHHLQQRPSTAFPCSRPTAKSSSGHRTADPKKPRETDIFIADWAE